MHTVAVEEHRHHTASLHLQPAGAARALRADAATVSITPALGTAREPVAAFIESRYRSAYGANMRADYPWLISVRDQDGMLVAAAGFRFAVTGPLFVERYLDRPLEEVLATRRERIAEVGNLVSVGGGASILLFAALAAHLYDLGFSDVAATATSTLARRLERLGLDPRTLCAADPDRVPDAPSTWGSYYRAGPRVIAGRVDRAVQCLRGLFGDGFYRRRPRLYPVLSFDAGAAR